MGKMGRHDWYRNEVWTSEAKAAFRERLDRSRGSFHKAQYLRIQALYLSQAGHHKAAIELLDELFEKHPDESQLASARLQRAECLFALGCIPEAVAEYRLSLQAERDKPTIRTNAWLDFACLIAFGGLSHLYEEASSVLDEFSNSNSLLFPAHRFQYAASRAFLADAKGDRDSARLFAKSAIENAAAKHSGFRYHPQLGLVNDLETRLENRLRAIAGDQ